MSAARSIAALALLTAVAAAQSAAPGDTAEARGRAIHARLLTLDTHKDISAQLASRTSAADPADRRRYAARFDPSVRGTNQVDFPKMREGGYDCAFFIVYVAQRRVDGAGFVRAKQEAMLKFDAIDRMCERFADDIELARTAADVRRLHDAGKLIACIGIENGFPMGEDLGLVEEFWRRGARYMSITHNGHNQLGDSHRPGDPLHGGLTELGRDAVREMNRVGIMVDVSHAARSTMLEAVELSEAPVIASHSGCRAVFDHTRNLDDEQLRALAAKGGVIQIVALDAFVRDQSARNAALDALRERLDLPGRWDVWQMEQTDDGVPLDVRRGLERFEQEKRAIDAEHPRASVADFVDHIDHAVAVAGIDHVGIGSDFDGGGGVDGWDDASESPNVTIELVRRGYSEADIAKIWSGNLLRVWTRVEEVARSKQVRWVDATELRIEGRGWSDTAGPYDRLPARAEAVARPKVWRLSRDSAGLCVRFRTDSPELHVKWSVTSEHLALPHMPATGASGVDLYVRHDGRWRWLATGKPRRFPDNEQALVRRLEPIEREYLAYLPLYNGVSQLAIGVTDSSTLEPLEERDGAIVFYGTSITQGGCASRPGMCHTAILGRRLDRPVVNLGFSGNGTLDLELAPLLGELDPAVFVLDCLPNLREAQIAERAAPFVRALREARPRTPILLVEGRTYQNAFLSAAAASRNRGSRAALRAAWQELVADGVQGLYYLEGDGLLGADGEGTVDGSHPTDLGFVRQADAFEPVLRAILEARASDR